MESEVLNMDNLEDQENMDEISIVETVANQDILNKIVEQSTNQEGSSTDINSNVKDAENASNPVILVSYVDMQGTHHCTIFSFSFYYNLQ